MGELVGIGIYTAAEASRLLRLPSRKITRWLCGHNANGRVYAPLWHPQVDIGDDHLYLGFRDLMEIRVAAAFIGIGIPAQRVRAAIDLAREVHGIDYPLSADRFRYAGRDIFLRVFEEDETGAERERLLNTFKRQYEFEVVLRPLLKNIEFAEDGTPRLWWPNGRSGQIVVDPQRAFGQPIDVGSSVPTGVLAAAAKAEGLGGASRIYEVPVAAVKRAVVFEADLAQRLAA